MTENLIFGDKSNLKMYQRDNMCTVANIEECGKVKIFEENAVKCKVRKIAE